MPRIRAASIDEHKSVTRRALLDAAKKLIGEAGTAEVPLGEIALVAGVGRTTFYEYFSDRDDVIASLVEEELPHVVADLIASVPEDLPTAERLGELAATTVEFVATDTVLGVILHREAGRLSQEAQDRIRDSHAELSAEIARLYGRGVEEGIFRPMPPELAGRLIQDTIMSAARVLIASGVQGAIPAPIAEGLGSFLLGGLGYTSDPKARR